MTTQLIPFSFETFTIRVVMQDDQPWWVAADVCAALEIGNPSDAIKRLDDDERTLVSIEGASNGLQVNAVNESGLYSLILGSRKPEAKMFKRWITHDVIPSIRQTGTSSVLRSLRVTEVTPIMSSNPLTLTVLDGSPRVDTRLIAAGFGVHPKNTRELVDNYSEKFQAFGLLRFETEAVKREGERGTKYEKFYLLNEDQTYFLLTLTRNTAQVVDLKQRLVQAFSEFRKGQPKPAKPRQLPRKHYQLLQSEVDEVAKWTAQPGRAKAAVWEHLRKIGGVENVRYFPHTKMTEALSILNSLKKRTRAFVNDSKASERVFIDTILSGLQALPNASNQPAFKLLEAA